MKLISSAQVLLPGQFVFIFHIGTVILPLTAAVIDVHVVFSQCF